MGKSILVLAVLFAGAAQAAPYSGTTGLTPLPSAFPLEQAAPIPLTVRYDPKRARYCVTTPARTGSRIASTACRTARAWNRSGELRLPVG